MIVCVPIGACGAVAKEIGPHLKPGATVSDVGSVKAAVVRDMAPHIPAGVHFIPGHPVAGTEDSGPDSGFAELFINRWCILTPAKDADQAAVERLVQFWKAFGSSVEIMSPEHHDLVLAVTSHVPHLIAYNIVGTAFDLRNVTESEVLKYSAGGFRDFTRIAASDPTMWRDIFMNNKEAVLEVLGRFNEDLSTLDARGAQRRRRHVIQCLRRAPRHPPRHDPVQPGLARAGFSATGRQAESRAAAAALRGVGRRLIVRFTAAQCGT